MQIPRFLKKFGGQYQLSKRGLSFKEKLTLALPGPASVIGPIIIHNTLMKFYTDIIGINPVYIGWIYFIYNIWNAINDPLLGVYVDKLKYNPKRGKYVYLMRVTAPVMMLSMFGMLLSSPAWEDWVIFLILLLELFFFDTAYTVYSVAYQSYFFVAAPTQEERIDVEVIRSYIGNAIGFVTTIIPTLLLVGNGNRRLIVPIFTLVICLNVLLYIIALRTLKDKAELYTNVEQQVHHSAGEVWQEAFAIMKSKPFLTYIIFFITARGAMAYYFTPFLFFMDKVVKSSGVVATIADVVPGLIMLAILPIVGNYIKRIGSKNMILLSYLPAALGFGGLLVINNPWHAVLCFTGIVVSLNMVQTAGVAINGALIDDNEMSTGVRKTGLYNGIFALFATTLTSVQSIIFTYVINSFGYNGTAAVQTEHAVLGIRIGAGLVPIIMGAIGLIPLLLFPIDRKREKEISEYSEKLRRGKEEVTEREELSRMSRAE